MILAAAALFPATAQSPPARPRITGIHHVAYRISDPAASRAFYAGVLGLTESPTPGARDIVFAIGRQQVVLELGLPSGQDERLSHVAFSTPDLEGLAVYLAARGVTVERAKELHSIRTSDPNGHTIEFVQQAWPTAEARTPGGGALSTRLLHTGILVHDEEAAQRFYRDVLGFTEIWRGGRNDAVTDWINVRVPDSTDYVEYMLSKTPPDRRQLGSMHHIALLVPDMQLAWEAAISRTPEARRAAMAPPQVGRNGRWQLNLYDPDGTRVELMEPFRIR